MKIRLIKIAIGSLILIISIILISGCTSNNEFKYSTPPVYISTFDLPDNLQPLKLIIEHDSLYVIYNKKAVIDIYTLDFKKVRTIALNDKETVFPTSFDLTDSGFVITDFFKNRVITYDKEGRLLHSFDSFPGGEIKLMPMAVDYFGGVAYVSDLEKNKILAISMVEVENLTEPGEIIVEIPQDTIEKPDFPTLVFITYDGRAIVGSSKSGRLQSYTCSGNYIYDFDSIESRQTPAPVGMIMDAVRDPDLVALDSNSFDPSNIRQMGRFHVADAANNKIHLFNPNGFYINSYPDDISFKKLSSVAIDYKNQIVYVSDLEASKIYKFRCFPEREPSSQ